MTPKLTPKQALFLVLGLLAAVRCLLGWWIPVPVIFPDELIYMELSRSVAQGHGLAFRGAASNLPTVLYPLMTAPLQLVRTAFDTYHLIQVANAVFMSLSAVPIFLLARRLVPAPAAVAVALLPLLAPYTLYSHLNMTEGLFLLVVSTLAYLTVRADAEDGLVWKLALGALLGVSFFIKPQGVLLPFIVAGALSAAEAGAAPAAWRRLWRFWPTAAAVAAGAALYVGRMAMLAGSLSLSALVGYYAKDAAGGTPFELFNFVRAAMAIVGAVAMSLGFWPVALFAPFAWHAARRGTRDERLVAAFSVLLGGALIALAARQVATSFPPQVQERYCFYVAPLLALGAACASRRRLARPGAVAAGAIALVLLSALFIQPAALTYVDTPTYAALYRPSLSLGWPLTEAATVLGGGLLVLLLTWLASAGRWKAVAAVLGTYGIVLSGFSFYTFKTLSDLYARQLPVVEWVQAHAAPDRPIAWVSDGLPYMAMMQLDVFSRQPIRALYLEHPFAAYLEERLTVAPDGTVPALGRLSDGTRILTSRAVPLRLPLLAERDGVAIYEKRGVVRLAPSR